jgi:hypothetical protein
MPGFPGGRISFELKALEQPFCDCQRRDPDKFSEPDLLRLNRFPAGFWKDNTFNKPAD